MIEAARDVEDTVVDAVDVEGMCETAPVVEDDTETAGAAAAPSDDDEAAAGNKIGYIQSINKIATLTFLFSVHNIVLQHKGCLGRLKSVRNSSILCYV